MSILPQYQKLGASDSDPFPIYPAKNRLSFEDDDDEVAPAYPPRQGTAGGDTSRNVTYTFEPRWPVKGTKENVLGVMGSDKDVSAFATAVLWASLGACYWDIRVLAIMAATTLHPTIRIFLLTGSSLGLTLSCP